MAIIWNDLAYKVLRPEQRSLLPLLETFSSTHILVGGTAIALQLGHRESIDFDLFCFAPQGTGKELFARIQESGCLFDLSSAPPFWLSEEECSELTLFINSVKVQWIDFSRNPFDITISIEHELMLCGIPSLTLESLGAMKVYAMMYRNKWKDAVDVAMIIQQGHSLADLVQKAKLFFKDLYKPMYTYETIIAKERDMTEKISWLLPDHPDDKEIQEILEKGIQEIL